MANAVTISIGNKVGGAGKTTTTAALAYVLSTSGKNVLVIDSEGQRDSGKLISKTWPNFLHETNQTLIYAFRNKEITRCINHVTEHLDLVKSDDRIEAINADGYKYGGKNVNHLLDKMLNAVRDKYDYILIDLPPAATSVLCNNGIFASDFVLVPAQSAPKDIDNTYAFISMLQTLRTQYNVKTNLLGVLPWLQEPNDKKDLSQVDTLRKELPGAVFESTIKKRKRIKYFFANGLTHEKMNRWDADWINQYTAVAKEINERIIALGGTL